MDENESSEDEVFSFDASERDTEELIAEIDSILQITERQELVDEILNDVDNLQSQNKRLESDLESFQTELSNNKSSFEDKIEDLREKIIRVAQNQKEKADKNHNHPEIKDEIDDLIVQLDKLDSRLSSSLEDIQSIEDKLNEKIQTVSDSEEELRKKTTRLAHSHLDLKDEVESLSDKISNKEEIKELRLKAIGEQVNQAKCSNCGSKIEIALLDKARCPFCEKKFKDIKSKILRSDQILVEK